MAHDTQWLLVVDDWFLGFQIAPEKWFSRLHIYIYIFIYLFVYTYIYIYMCVHIYNIIYIYYIIYIIYIYTHVYIHMYIYICIHICMHIYIYIRNSTCIYSYFFNILELWVRVGNPTGPSWTATGWQPRNRRWDGDGDGASEFFGQEKNALETEDPLPTEIHLPSGKLT